MVIPSSTKMVDTAKSSISLPSLCSAFATGFEHLLTIAAPSLVEKADIEGLFDLLTADLVSNQTSFRPRDGARGFADTSVMLNVPSWLSCQPRDRDRYGSARTHLVVANHFFGDEDRHVLTTVRTAIVRPTMVGISWPRRGPGLNRALVVVLFAVLDLLRR